MDQLDKQQVKSPTKDYELEGKVFCVKATFNVSNGEFNPKAVSAQPDNWGQNFENYYNDKFNIDILKKLTMNIGI